MRSRFGARLVLGAMMAGIASVPARPVRDVERDSCGVPLNQKGKRLTNFDLEAIRKADEKRKRKIGKRLGVAE